MSFSDVPWCLWGAVFLAFEIPAVANTKPGDTLSETLRSFFAYSGNSPRFKWARRIAWPVCLTLLGLHIAGVPYLSG